MVAANESTYQKLLSRQFQKQINDAIGVVVKIQKKTLTYSLRHLPICYLPREMEKVEETGGISQINGPFSSNNEISNFANTRIDWKETPEAHVFKADLPALKKEEVKVEVEDGRVLQISGERSVEKEDKNDKWHRVERGSGKFLRRFRLPENAKIDEVKASLENGVLTVTVPKVPEKKPEVKPIQITERRCAAY
ncbi:Class I heat shock protein [Quillaja saponaria]|uniref:Class I heat shock protein n=1 Tax=Quillaja saponaria TaxID=32244 RepID=A0AAD7PMS9_QUISA|nr:Class I heat shock protein [Quillaja saponaria]